MSRRRRPPAKPAAGDERERRVGEAPPGAVDLAIALVILLFLIARAGLAFVPGMWAWSLNLQRFVHPLVGWGLWGLAALALVPAFGRRAAPWLERAGDAMVRFPGRAGWVAAALVGSLVGLLPDRVRFVGDFLLRQGTVEVAEQPSVLFPQALPLDVLLHYHLPRYLTDSALFSANSAARWIGVLEAAALAALAVAFARTLGLRGVAAFSSVVVVVCGGYLGMFTGFSKAFADLCLLLVGVGVYGLRAMRDGRGLLPLGLAFALGVALHRSALGLLPAAALAWATWIVRHGRAGAWRRPANLLGLAIPVAALAVMIPRIAAVVARFDAIHFTPAAVRSEGGVLAAALSGLRPADLLNLLTMLSPLAVLIPVLLVTGSLQRQGGRAEGAFLAVLALPFVGIMPFIHPVHGLFRDWDDFAATGVALSLLAAWAVGVTLSRSPRAAWAAAAIAMATAAPSLQWLAIHADLDRGLARVRAFMVESPLRPPSERGHTWDYLGIRNFNLDRLDAAAEAFSHAAETAPSPRVLQQWALAETMRGNYREAQVLYRRMLDKAPENALGWLGLATVSLNAEDLPEARRAGSALLALQPGNPDAIRVLEEVAAREAARQKPVAP